MDHLRTVRAIRSGQAVGRSLAEIALLMAERHGGGRQAMLKAMNTRRGRLNRKADEIAATQNFVEAKINWLRRGALGTPPGIP